MTAKVINYLFFSVHVTHSQNVGACLQSWIDLFVIMVVFFRQILGKIIQVIIRRCYIWVKHNPNGWVQKMYVKEIFVMGNWAIYCLHSHRNKTKNVLANSHVCLLIIARNSPTPVLISLSQVLLSILIILWVWL